MIGHTSSKLLAIVFNHIFESQVKDRAVNDENNYVRRAVVLALAQGWYDDPEIISLIKKIEKS